MRTGRPKKFVISVNDRERRDLQVLVKSRSLSHSLVRRAQMILWSAEGLTDSKIAQRLQTSHQRVSYWRMRYATAGVAGLSDAPKSGRPRTIDDERVASVLNKVLHTKPKGGSHWSVRGVAEETGVSKSQVQRYFSLFGLQPHRQKSFKLSTDPFFVDKLHDIVGLYLNPPENALVLCVDEKSQVQALQRTQPLLPMGLGYVEGVTHDYIRHGTTTLFAALDAASGEVLAQCKLRHRHQEFLSFLRHVDRHVPKTLDVHLILDNYGTHKHPKVRAWLAARSRYHLHYTPTYSSWLNQVERWFGLITQQAIRRDSYTSVPDLVRKIEAYVQHYNHHKRPFVWTATAESILAKIERLCSYINGTRH